MGNWMNKIFACLLGMAILFGADLLLEPQSAYACSCAAPESPEKQVKAELDYRSAIFAGTVQKITPPSWFRIIRPTADPVKVTFKVSEVWKGNIGRQTIVYTALGSDSCGVEYLKGTEYIVSASLNSKSMETNLCSMTKPLADASNELAVLGEGYPPADNDSGKVVFSIIAITATIIVGGAVVIRIIRHRRKFSP
ncbi:hypothetical protein [Cohnella lupini]|uniref:Tissue inhibitor of metalloproteinase n=1 Tax=Cohnella lupini TaxID=1294267 RepID=A0A3D9I1A3_9BACL|nr:hypothetical protein [Cohnella lupini]RED55548.1 tissue inhibitor of metalloproteinase [Cohnella lupini]